MSRINVSANISFPLVECVLNLSEGRDIEKISHVVRIFNSEKNVHVLHQDIGYDVNRTVLTIAGELKHLFFAIEKVISYSASHFNITTHSGTHPRLGILDVIPFIPLVNISSIELERRVKTWSAKVASRFLLPIYYYGRLSSNISHPPLSFFRRGSRTHQEYLLNNILPDTGPAVIHPRLGISCITVREFMIAINFNLQNCNFQRAKEFAAHLRKHRKNMSDLDTTDVRFLAWKLDDLKVIQISTNIYDIQSVTMLELYNYIKKEANNMNLDISGSELIGLAPKAGISRSTQVVEAAKIMGLSSVKPFIEDLHILENQLNTIVWDN